MGRKVTSKGKRAAKTFGQSMGQERMAEIYTDIFKRGHFTRSLEPFGGGFRNRHREKLL